MKHDFPHIGLAKLCGWFGITRQAYYQQKWEAQSRVTQQELVLKQVIYIRKSHRRIGTRKLYEMLRPFMDQHGIKMGRDALFNLLSDNYLLMRQRRRRVQTTNSYHWFRKYPNLIRDFTPTGPDQLLVSDITYWKFHEVFLYISFVTDAYSHKIVGYHLASTLESIESVQALKMALACLQSDGGPKPIHHSDRGIQY